jgi:hypothetical protein
VNFKIEGNIGKQFEYITELKFKKQLNGCDKNSLNIHKDNALGTIIYKFSSDVFDNTLPMNPQIN